MSDPFASPAVERHPDPRVTHTTVPFAQVTEPSGDESGWRGWLHGTEVWSQPQPALRDLVVDAHVESDRTRWVRLIWLVTVSRACRFPPWIIHRLLLPDPPRLGGEQPPIREVLSGAGETHWSVRWSWVAARYVAWVADSPSRVGVAVLLVWLAANAVGSPAGLTVGYWVQAIIGVFQAITGTWNSGVSASATAAPAALENVAGIMLLLAGALWVLCQLRPSRKEES